MIEQQKTWQEALLQTRQITDGFGRSIDKSIIETVAILRLLGFRTTMSCSGHIRRYTGGPYVVFTSVQAKEYEVKRSTVVDNKSPAYKSYEKKALLYSVRERQKLHYLLEKFYEKHTSSYHQRLIVTSLNLSSSRLCCQNPDLAYVLDTRAKEKLLIANQAEMTLFTNYLKSVYIT